MGSGLGTRAGAFEKAGRVDAGGGANSLICKPDRAYI